VVVVDGADEKSPAQNLLVLFSISKTACVRVSPVFRLAGIFVLCFRVFSLMGHQYPDDIADRETLYFRMLISIFSFFPGPVATV
jgi:hypothetical protein